MSDLEKDLEFKCIAYVEPNAKGCPVGMRGALGWSSDEVYNPKVQAERYLKSLSEDCIKIVKRLRELEGADDPNTQDIDSKLDMKLRHHLYNLFRGISYLETEIKAIE